MRGQNPRMWCRGCFALGVAALSAWFPGVPASADTIAYIAPSREGREIRLVEPDGRNERTIFRVPEKTHRNDGVRSLAWSPDGKRLAFSSSHEWRRSLLIEDVYVIPREGGELLRPTDPPDPGAYDKYPKGRVIVEVVNAGDHGSKFDVFVEGAAEPVFRLLRRETKDTIVVDNVADMGETGQFVRVYNHSSRSRYRYCWLDIGAMADVSAGKTVDAGKLSYSNGMSCARAFAPTWLDDETLALLVIESSDSIIEPTADVWSVRTDATSDVVLGGGGSRLFRSRNFGNDFDNLFALVAGPQGDEPQIALLRKDTGGTSLLFAPPDDMAQMRRIPTPCPTFSRCNLLGLAWRPDGEAIFYSQHLGSNSDTPAAGVLYEVENEHREILRLPGEVIGRVALSPDGRTIAFERAARLRTSLDIWTFGDQALCPCSIWLVDVDGGNLRRLAEDGRAPAWSR